MADVFISNARADGRIAVSVADALHRSGLSVFVDLKLDAHGSIANAVDKEIKSAGLILIIWSAAAARSEWIKSETQLALDAWESDRLLLLQLDDTALPLGLRDLDTLRVPEGGVPDETVDAIAEEARRRQRLAQPVSSGDLPGPPRAATPEVTPTRSAIPRRTLLAALLLLTVLVMLRAITSNSLRPPPEPSQTPGAVAPLPPKPAPAEPDPEPPKSVPAPPEPWWRVAFAVLSVGLPIAAGVALVVASIVLVLGLRRRSAAIRTANLDRMPHEGPPDLEEASPTGAVFVSYSRVDAPKVTTIVDGLERSGLRTWMDTKREADAQRFARPIVHAIRGSRACAFMCSPAAYRSDHVVRELYLADKYLKTMIPVEIEPDAPPEDFEYFFSGLDIVPAKPIDACVQSIMRRLQSIQAQ